MHHLQRLGIVVRLVKKGRRHIDIVNLFSQSELWILRCALPDEVCFGIPLFGDFKRGRNFF